MPLPGAVATRKSMAPEAGGEEMAHWAHILNGIYVYKWSINGLYPAEFLIMFLQHSNVLLSQRNKAFPWLEMSPQSAGTLN